MKWISVDSEMPKARTEIILSDGKNISIGHLINEKYGWHWSEDDYLECVKYWMPLPNLPEVPEEMESYETK